MHKSLRTRLLLSAYRAALDLAHRLHQFASSLQGRAAASETRDYEDYLGKLDEERIVLVDVLDAAEGRLTEIEEEHDRVAGILGYTPRPQVPPFNEVQHITPSDLTELTPHPQWVTALTQVDAEDAPQGYKAVRGGGGCTGCFFDPTKDCPNNTEGGVPCVSPRRDDEQDVIFVRR